LEYHDYIKFAGTWFQVNHSIGTNAYDVGKTMSQRDGSNSTVKYKEPEPAWFRNLTSERPLRRKHKNELRKFKLDSNYEPDIIDKGRLKYWT